MQPSSAPRFSESEIHINVGSSQVGGANRASDSSHNILLQRHDEFVPEKTNCPTCKKATTSINRKVAGELTWMWCSFAAILSLCFLPFFLESCNDTQIFCTECLELKQEKRSDCCNNC